MRLIELEIENVRGIRHLVLKPQGGNFAVWGPNGSGKSAVVDAIDFLLTGEIMRLTGKGTGNISLGKHGPHIDCKPDDAKVRAIIHLNGGEEPIEISRCMAHPKALICKDSDLALLEPVLILAQRGHHVLTRREILRYITAEGSARAQEIQELLNISEIENIRKSLVKVQNDFFRDLQSARQAVKTAEGAVCATLALPSFDLKVVLQKVNQNRAVFGKPPINELGSNELKIDLSLPPAIAGTQAINVTLVQNDIENLKKTFNPINQADIAENDKRLRNLLQGIRKDPKVLRTLSLRELLSLGIGLIDDSGECPLCEKAWPPGELLGFLQSRLSMADAAQQTTSKVESLTQSLIIPISSSLRSLQNVIAVARLIDLKDILSDLEKWETDMQNLLEGVTSAISNYPNNNFDTMDVACLMAPKDSETFLSKIILEVKSKFPEATPEQTAWDTLTSLVQNIKALESAQLQCANNELYWKRAVTLTSKFEIARDSVLGSLYDSIKDRFVELYKKLHEEDEKSFNATLKPVGAALDFEVDFYGRGVHPPHALHSEGHQDSMGLCLYLALAERLTGGLLNLVILDDVVMSVDADHRRQLCHLFVSAFPDRQFLITTHDKTWSTQLKCEGVIPSRSMVEFYNWNIDSGPQVNAETELWDQISKDLERNDIPAASAKLRRGSEEFFSMVCDTLQAPVVFKLNGRWELGDLLPSAMKQYKYLVKLAKISANSWNLRDLVSQLDEIDNVASTVYKRTNAEQWAVNANVHYNNWSNFTRSDFLPVVEVFQDLFGIFRCTTCGAILTLSEIGITPSNVRCNCGQVNWNLIEKKTRS